MFADNTTDQGVIQVFGENGNLNVQLARHSSGTDNGRVSVMGASGAEKGLMYVENGIGRTQMLGQNGNPNVVLSNSVTGNDGFIGVAGTAGTTKADMFTSVGTGIIRTFSANNSRNVVITGAGASGLFGAIRLYDDDNEQIIEMKSDETNDFGVLEMNGLNGNLNVQLSAINNDFGRISVGNFAGNQTAEMFASPANGIGIIRTRGQNGSVNVLLTSRTGAQPNRGGLFVYDEASNVTCGFRAIGTNLGNMFVIGGSKAFVEPHPTQPEKDIWYACIEGPEAAAYTRGTAKLVNGKAVIPFPEHFALLANFESATVTLTPNSAESKGLAKISCTADGLVVQELSNGTGNYAFDWTVMAVRKGHEDFEVIRPRSERGGEEVTEIE